MFGKGKLDLTDPEEAEDDVKPTGESDDNSNASKSKASSTNEQSSTKGYGSTDISSPKNSLWTIETAATSPQNNNNEDDRKSTWEDENGSSKQDASGNDEEAARDTEEVFHERPGRPPKPTRHCCVRMFFAVETFAIITNLTLFLSQLLPMLSASWEESDKGYLALKIYLCVFAIIFLLVEIDHDSISFLRKASFLRTFCSRGFLYTFFGLVCYEEADSAKAYKALKAKVSELSSVFEVSWAALINQIAAISLISLGVLYFLMGIFCLQRLRNRHVYNDRKKWKEYREALEKWDHGL